MSICLVLVVDILFCPVESDPFIGQLLSSLTNAAQAIVSPLLTSSPQQSIYPRLLAATAQPRQMLDATNGTQPFGTPVNGIQAAGNSIGLALFDGGLGLGSLVASVFVALGQIIGGLFGSYNEA